MAMEKVFWQGTFEEAEEREIEYYASLTWQKSAEWVEAARKKIWGDDYPRVIEKIFRITSLKEDRDDSE